MSVMGPGWALCQVSSSVCRRSRSASRAALRGARSLTIASKPFQNASGATPVPGSTCSLMKRCSSVATCRLAAEKAEKAEKADAAFNYFVQAGAFRSQGDADAQRAKLAMLGWEARVSEREQNGITIFRVRVGPFTKRDDAEQLKQKLDGAGVESTLVRAAR